MAYGVEIFGGSLPAVLDMTLGIRRSLEYSEGEKAQSAKRAKECNRPIERFKASNNATQYIFDF